MKTFVQLFRSVAAGLVAGIALAAASVPLSSEAAGLLIADGGFGGVLDIKEQEAEVTVNNGIAVTKVTQVFHNTEKRQVEALYTFPVPKGASVANFSMWINGKEMIGEVVEKQRARQIYESYKQTRRDPGLLEQVDYRTFEMRVFPIGPEADQKVQITYYQELDFDHDVATYVYPLATVTRPGVNARTTGRFAINFHAKSAVPITEVESPSHGSAFAVARQSDNYWSANLETTGGSLAEDVVIACHVQRPKTGIDLITSKSKLDREDGFFCLTITAGQEVAQKQDSMDYVFVVDASGSMADSGKLVLSKDAVAAFLNELGENDRFEVMTFNVQPSLAFNKLEAADAVHKQQAIDYLGRQPARGGTVLQPAISTAYKYAAADRPLNVVILSDGMTEQRERAILLQQIQSRPGNTRVFCIGVGNDVNRPLLEQLADDSGGIAAFISSGDNFARQARAFRQKLMRPFATGLKLDFAGTGVEVHDVEPASIPNLYFGSPVRVYGRYRGAGSGQVTVRGSINGIEFKQAATLEFPKMDPGNPEIDRLWAWHRINALLKQADRQGDRSPVANEIVRLGEQFSIVTEYTSFIVLENDAEYQRWKIERRNLDATGRDRSAQAKLREQLDSIRDRSLAGLGPQNDSAPASSTGKPVQLASSAQPSSAPVSPASSGRSTGTPANGRQSWDFSGTGTSPVGPLGVLAAAWFLRRKQRVS